MPYCQLNSHNESHNYRVAKQHSRHNFSGISSPSVLFAVDISTQKQPGCKKKVRPCSKMASVKKVVK